MFAERPLSHLLILTNHREEFEKKVNECKLPGHCYSITFRSRSELARTLLAADCGLLIRDDDIINRVSSPTKLAEYLAAGVPVLAMGAVGDYGPALERERIGVLVETDGEATEKISVFMRSITEDREGYWLRCREWCAKNLSWEGVGRELIELYMGLATGGSGNAQDR
jgi:glycosyltransferase involved in cell wall biosynthesis